MAITLSQQDYWDLVHAPQSQEPECPANTFETVVPYPAQLGQGYYRFIELREGLELLMGHYQLHDDVIMQLPERSHPIEYGFYISGRSHEGAIAAGQYLLYGSGLAPAETWGDSADAPILEVNVHLEPAVLQTFLGESFDLTSAGLGHLVRPAEQLYYGRLGTTTVAMQTTLHQLLHCPFQGITQKMYLESKVWELMSLLIEQERSQANQGSPTRLSTDDIDRIHHARDILAQRFNDPPSLLDLARQVGLNDCTLKRGFRQVFGETAFGYLHDYRMEQARQFLQAGDLNVSEAARSVGFSNRSYFAAAFRKKYGISPKQYLSQAQLSG